MVTGESAGWGGSGGGGVGKRLGKVNLTDHGVDGAGVLLVVDDGRCLLALALLHLVLEHLLLGRELGLGAAQQLHRLPELLQRLLLTEQQHRTEGGRRGGMGGKGG